MSPTPHLEMQDSSMCRTLVMQCVNNSILAKNCDVCIRRREEIYSEIRIFHYHVLHIILTTKLQYTFVTNKFISINFLFSISNSSSFVTRFMNNKYSKSWFRTILK